MTISDYELKNKNKKDIKEFKGSIIEDLKGMHNSINESKNNYLNLADISDYYHNRYITEKEKLDLLEEVIEMIYNYK